MSRPLYRRLDEWLLIAPASVACIVLADGDFEELAHALEPFLCTTSANHASTIDDIRYRNWRFIRNSTLKALEELNAR